jgi:hypothetical protein
VASATESSSQIRDLEHRENLRRRVNIESNPLSWLYGDYSAQASLAVMDFLSAGVRADLFAGGITEPKGRFGRGYEVHLRANIHLNGNRARSGFFFTPGIFYARWQAGQAGNGISFVGNELFSNTSYRANSLGAEALASYQVFFANGINFRFGGGLQYLPVEYTTVHYNFLDGSSRSEPGKIMILPTLETAVGFAF